MLIEIHLIQNHSPSNLNRDDLGAPKTCLFGGVTRARISSQCLKRSIRNPGRPADDDGRGAVKPGPFAEAMAAHMGTRTKLFPHLVGEVLAAPRSQARMTELGWDDSTVSYRTNAIVAACRTIARAEDKTESETRSTDRQDSRPQTAQLIFLSRLEAEAFVAGLLDAAAGGEKDRKCFEYFLDPQTVFASLLGPELDRSSLSDEQRGKVLKAGWRIRNTGQRLAQIRNALQPSGDLDDDAAVDDQDNDESATEVPDEEVARQIVDGLEIIALGDEKQFERLTKPTGAKGEPKIERTDPPSEFNKFVQKLAQATCQTSVDVALFGRMTTSNYFRDVPAAMQVAHAFSTHEVITEVDYFTAVDDVALGTGAGHVDEAMFNSACFYKYFCLDWDQLVTNLAGPEPKADQNGQESQAQREYREHIKPAAERLAACTLGHFLRAAVRTTPSGKQNSFASHCEPSAVLVEIKDQKIPTSYANAFAEPAERKGRPDDDAPDVVSLLGRSIAQFGDHVHALRNAYRTDSHLFWHALPLHRYPLRGWRRDDEGKKVEPVRLPAECFEVLGGQSEASGLIEAVIEAVGFDWTEVRNLGTTPEAAS